MNFNDLDNPSCWAIAPDALETMLRSIPSQEKSAELAIRFTEDPSEVDDFMLRNGVAIIPVTGPLFKRRNFLSYLFGGASMAELAHIMTAAINDSDVQAILLDIDSPGGQVSGTDAFASLVYQARQKKPVVAYANGMMASGAYWIGSAASKVIVERTAGVGSIGVFYMHLDRSRSDANRGLKRTLITAGEFKAVGNDAEPLSDRDRKVIQAELDEIYSLFIDSVALHRGVSTKEVSTNMAEGRVFIGQQAVDAGLADGVGALQEAFAVASSMISEQPVVRTSRSHKTPLRNARHAKTPENDAGRILGLLPLHFGKEAAAEFQSIVETGITPEQYLAIGPRPRAQGAQGLEKLLKVKADLLAAIQAAGAANPGPGGEDSEGDFIAMVEAIQAKKKCSKTRAMLEVAQKHPALHQKYIQRHNQGYAV